MGPRHSRFVAALAGLFALLWSALAIAPVELCVDAARGWWSYVLPAALMMTLSATYELTEWLAAVVFGGDLGAAFLGTQGDEWDAQKDTALASAGALAAMLATAAWQSATGRDFAREWNDRLRRERPRRPAAASPR
jgi:putative membrane protein